MMRISRTHWPEYLIEGGGLACFMLVACVLGVLFQHPSSPLLRLFHGEFERRIFFGIGMGLTSVSIVYSPWGKQSGAHLNPCLTMTFWYLGKIALPDAIGYITAQFFGGILGVGAARVLLGPLVADASVHYVPTVPGQFGVLAAFVGEFAISFGLMIVVLAASNNRRVSRYTGFFAGILVATYITVEAPVSGMSMNSARTLASAIHAMTWTSVWLYFIAPPLGMLAAARLYVILAGRDSVFCAKLHHDNKKRCIFCEWRVATAKGDPGIVPKPQTAN